MTVLKDNQTTAKAAATVLLTAPGAPFIYYGEEIGMLGDKPDPQIRNPMQWDDSENGGFTSGTPWEALQPDFKTKNVKAQDGVADSLLNHYRQMIRLRSEHVALRAGQYVRVRTNTNKLFVSLRTTPEESVLVLVNLGSEPVTNPVLSWDTSLLNGAYDPTLLLGAGQVAPLTVQASGGAANYVPVPEIPANGQVIVQIR